MYRVLCSPNVSVSKVHVVVEPESSWKLTANTALRLLMLYIGPDKLHVDVVPDDWIAGEDSPAVTEPFTTILPFPEEKIAGATEPAITLPEINIVVAAVLFIPYPPVNPLPETLPVIINVDAFVPKFIPGAVLVLDNTLPEMIMVLLRPVLVIPYAEPAAPVILPVTIIKVFAPVFVIALKNAPPPEQFPLIVIVPPALLIIALDPALPATLPVIVIFPKLDFVIGPPEVLVDNVLVMINILPLPASFAIPDEILPAPFSDPVIYVDPSPFITIAEQ